MTPPRPSGIWSRRATLDRWHRVWISLLDSQIVINPNHPATEQDLAAYINSAARFANNDIDHEAWMEAYDEELQRVGHEVVAALNCFNRWSERSFVHLGSTSCDVTEAANQWGIRESLSYVQHRVRIIERLMAHHVVNHDGLQMVARTHGQPAQLTTWGYRNATILEPLVHWTDRLQWLYGSYYNRPPYGAVGTAADAVRVLTGWKPAPEAPTMPLEATGSASEPPEGVEIPERPSATTEWLLTMGDRMAAQLKTAKNPDVAAVAANYERIRQERDVEPRRRCTWVQVTLGSPRRCTLADPHFTGDDTEGHILGAAYDVKDWQETSGNVAALTRRVPLWDTSYPGEERPDVSEPLNRYVVRTASRTAYGPSSLTSRQVYHRSQDLPWMSMLVELASLAQTWATDRRLESMLGLGYEQMNVDQVGSSAMPHKNNPRYCERICALAVVTRSHLSAFAELASQEWLEGDVSGSAARRTLLHGVFANIDALLQNWAHALVSWQVDGEAMENEADFYRDQLATGALIQAAVEAGMPRPEAHERIREAHKALDDRQLRGESFGHEWTLADALDEMKEWVELGLETELVIATAREYPGEAQRLCQEVVVDAQAQYEGHPYDDAEVMAWIQELR